MIGRATEIDVIETGSWFVMIERSSEFDVIELLILIR